ncbi:Uncharacterised protein [Mycobacterium tuberculosis]|nr:Uncharacterised protein [Mycobacterium tuberculosis]
MSHSPDSRLRQARCTATSDDEHAVCTAMLGPRRLNACEIRVARKSLSFCKNRLNWSKLSPSANTAFGSRCDSRLCSR